MACSLASFRTGAEHSRQKPTYVKLKEFAARSKQIKRFSDRTGTYQNSTLLTSMSPIHARRCWRFSLPPSPALLAVRQHKGSERELPPARKKI